MLSKPAGRLSSPGRCGAGRQACRGISPSPYQFICQFIYRFVHCGAGGAAALTPPSAQHRSLRWGPRLSFPNRRQRGTPGDLTSFLSKNNGQAFGSTGGKGREEDAGQWDLTEKESHRAHALAPPEPAGTGGGYLPGHNVPGDNIYQCPRGGQPAPCGADGHAAGLNAGLPGPWQRLPLAGLCGLRTDIARHRCQRCGGDPNPGAGTTCRGTTLKEEVDGLWPGEARMCLGPREGFSLPKGKAEPVGQLPLSLCQGACA